MAAALTDRCRHRTVFAKGSGTSTGMASGLSLMTSVKPEGGGMGSPCSAMPSTCCGERLLGSFERLIEGGCGGDGAGEIRERDAEAAIFVLMDQGDVVFAHDGLGFGALSIVQAAAVVLAGAASAAVVAVWVCCSLQGFLRSRFGGGCCAPISRPPYFTRSPPVMRVPSLCVHGFPQTRSSRLARAGALAFPRSRGRRWRRSLHRSSLGAARLSKEICIQDSS